MATAFAPPFLRSLRVDCTAIGSGVVAVVGAFFRREAGVSWSAALGGGQQAVEVAPPGAVVVGELVHLLGERTGVLDESVEHHLAFAVDPHFVGQYGCRLQAFVDAGDLSTVGDSFDNAMAEAVNNLYKTELIRQRGPWRTVEQVELATLEYVWWWNNQRLHGELEMRTPLEVEAAYYAAQESAQPALAGQGNA